QPIEEKSSEGTLQHHYDELGNLNQTRLPDGPWLNRLYYGSGHLHQINLNGHVISDFERDRLHREVLRTQGRLSTRQHYDR
ncbi:RHS repeat protein, partial [Pantoea sp. SIMBA_072]